MSTFALKLLAIIVMAVDHVTAVFVPFDSWLYLPGRLIGRLAFPIFAFLLVEGFHHTRSVKKYLTRLGIFALISELPFDLAFYNSHFSVFGGNIKTDLPGMFSNPQLYDTVVKRFLEYQNIFFTLFLGLSAIWLISEVEKKYHKNILILNLLNALITVGLSLLAELMNTDYGFMGVLLIVAFYLFRGKKIFIGLSLLLLSGNIIQAFSTLAVLPIAFYNGKKGKSMKYFFYAFYPAHLLLLYVLLLAI
ncbi:MAG: hypothetical protein GX059_10235 [Clostridiales bacterium]|nr:hypothetical protein [Clostridiales bacterium]